MKQGWLRDCAVLVAVFAIFSAGCSFNRALVSYEEYGNKALLKSGSIKGAERLGRVYADEGGAIWKNCTKMAKAAIWLLIDETKRKGGNAIGNIIWFPKEKEERKKSPHCKKRWGFFALWPFLLTPLFASATVEGVAYKVDGWKPKKGKSDDDDDDRAQIYLIPKSHDETEKLVDQIVLGLN